MQHFWQNAHFLWYGLTPVHNLSSVSLGGTHWEMLDTLRFPTQDTRHTVPSRATMMEPTRIGLKKCGLRCCKVRWYGVRVTS